MKLIQKLNQYIQEIKSWAASKLNPEPKDRQEQIAEYAKEKAQQLCYDPHNGQRYTPDEVKYFLDRLKIESGKFLAERANKHREQSKLLHKEAIEENTRAELAEAVAGMLT